MNICLCSSFGCASPLAVATVVGFLDLRRVSSSKELKSFSLSMCIDAPSGLRILTILAFFEEGAGITQASAGE